MSEPAPVRHHRLKTWPEFFQAIVEGRKPFDYRLNDREFAVGDILHLEEWVPAPTDVGANPNDGSYYTGRVLLKRVTYILDEKIGPTMKAGFVIMGIEDAVSDMPTPAVVEAAGLTQPIRDALDEQQAAYRLGRMTVTNKDRAERIARLLMDRARNGVVIDEEFVTKARKTMKAFQVGFGGRDALAKAHDAMADGYGIIGRLLAAAGHPPS